MRRSKKLAKALANRQAAFDIYAASAGQRGPAWNAYPGGFTRPGSNKKGFR